MYKSICRLCQSKLNIHDTKSVCPACGKGSIYFDYDLTWSPAREEHSIWRYENLLPLAESSHRVTLGEGWTPLIHCEFDFQPHVYLKDETRNPTGSMKDRAMSVAYSKAKELQVKQTVLISAGGLGIAASAYASRAGIRNTILIPLGVSMERKMTMQIYGSQLIEIDGTIEECLQLLEDLVDKKGLYQTTTYRKGNPYTSEGPKTIAYELYEQMSQIPDFIIVPVGGGGTLSGIWNGFTDLKKLGLIDRLPVMIGVQNERFNGLEIALQRGFTTDDELRGLDHEIDCTQDTVTASIKHAYVPDGIEALNAIRDTNGSMVTVSDAEAMQGQKEMAKQCGIYAEPSSATVLIALKKLIKSGQIQKHHHVVLPITGSGYRDLASTIRYHGVPSKLWKPDAAFEYIKTEE